MSVYAVAKRAIDLAGASVGLTLGAPAIAAAALAIKLEDRGPIVFRQERVGRDGSSFHVFKLRTMIVDAHTQGAGFAVDKGDSRITRIGSFLRKTSIDELPQLFNVLKGDMSLVGPRPLPIRDYEGFSEDWHRRRFSVRPGITCLWQVMGRSSIPFEKWMELDMQYIDRWSLWLDLKILAQTIPAVLRGFGAA